jgi:CRP-like cAMP-binding protein
VPESSVKEKIRSLPPTHVRKGEILLRAGEMTNAAYYVETGCLRSYLIDDKGKEHIYQFAPEDWIISDEEAMQEQKPALLYIDAIEDSVIRVIHQPSDLKSNLDNDTAQQLLNSLEKKVNAFRRRIIQLLSATAEERYLAFIKTYPDLAQRVPLKMIASYLGITPESLSRVRKELVSRK